MRFELLEILHFRNLTEVQLELGSGVNCFHGENGAGKTALLEAVHLLCRGRSFRTQKSQSLIQNGQDSLIVRGLLRSREGTSTSLAVSKDRKARTEMRRNGQPERRLSDIARLTPLQVMLPDVADLVFGGPSKRRSWLDWGTFHVKPEYLVLLRRYLRAVRQRNSLIKSQVASAQLQPWNVKTAELADAVTRERLSYLSGLEPHLTSALSRMAPELGEGLQVAYQRGWGPEESLHKLLGERHTREVKYGSTLWGPHRADVQIRMHGTMASSILSRGQGKLVASAMQVAQAALLAELENRSTVFLIDDIGAELDLAHNDRFFGLLDDVGGQVLATTTRDPAKDGFLARMANVGTVRHRVFHVKRGTVRGA